MFFVFRLSFFSPLLLPQGADTEQLVEETCPSFIWKLIRSSATVFVQAAKRCCHWSPAGLLQWLMKVQLMKF